MNRIDPAGRTAVTGGNVPSSELAPDICRRAIY
jgi:hypothetical protein